VLIVEATAWCAQVRVFNVALRVQGNEEKGERDMKHIRTLTVSKAQEDCDLVAWLEDLWAQVVDFFKGLFGDDAA
jgi:hypothetical protein